MASTCVGFKAATSPKVCIQGFAAANCNKSACRLWWFRPYLRDKPSEIQRNLSFSGGWSTAKRGVRANNEIGKQLQVFVRENNVDQALRILKKKMQREGIFREMKRRKAYEKPSERKTREKAEAVRRARKAARKQAQRDGLLPAPKRREETRGGMAGRGRPPRFEPAAARAKPPAA